MSTQTKPEQDKATARPWNCPKLNAQSGDNGVTVYDANGRALANFGITSPSPIGEAESNATLTVRAVNEYDALKDLEETIKLVVGEGIIDSYLIEQKLATLAALRKEQS